MDALNYWWNRVQNLRKMVEDYRKEHNLKDIEQCVERLLAERKLNK